MVSFTNRKERGELLEGLVVSNKDATIPNFQQPFDPFRYRDLGEKATFEGIKKAGHLVHLERPCAYNRCLKRFLTSLHAAHEAQN
ncbi:hypothetical protein RHGRI_023617 [Rhododendron griersonianum]|uniref:Uncharacterized protein n=1 Tax=Rhododendron griersonianum TaxID=479676 RepID=A0AAV6J419_9ERIC|nr:hypothetical protein RHGRI_023617 [Rhododendron griersonianum]